MVSVRSLSGHVCVCFKHRASSSNSLRSAADGVCVCVIVARLERMCRNHRASCSNELRSSSVQSRTQRSMHDACDECQSGHGGVLDGIVSYLLLCEVGGDWVFDQASHHRVDEWCVASTKPVLALTKPVLALRDGWSSLGC